MGKTIVVCDVDNCPDRDENGECKKDIIHLSEEGTCEEN